LRRATKISNRLNTPTRCEERPKKTTQKARSGKKGKRVLCFVHAGGGLSLIRGEAHLLGGRGRLMGDFVLGKDIKRSLFEGARCKGERSGDQKGGEVLLRKRGYQGKMPLKGKDRS